MNTVYFIPKYLKCLDNWILWKKETDNKGRTTKIPYSPNYEGKAKTNDSTTWSSYTKVKTIFEKYKTIYDGIGIVLNKQSNIVFIDIDHCFENGEILEEAKNIINMFPGSYIELSQSGEGVHILTRGKIDKNIKNSKYGIEMYDNKRFIAFTGNSIQANEPINEQGNIDMLFKRYNTNINYYDNKVIKHDVNYSETEIIRMACKSKKSGAKFTDLYCGNWQIYFNSQSEADQSLCNMLAFWCNRDTQVMDNIFRSSGLMRKKWDRFDYRNNTLNKAVYSCTKDIAEYLEEKNRERM